MRILVVFEPGRAGKAALVRARSLAEQGHSTVTVVSVVPQAPIATRCGCAPVDAALRRAGAEVEIVAPRAVQWPSPRSRGVICTLWPRSWASRAAKCGRL